MSRLNAQGRRQVKSFASPKGTGDDTGKDAYPIHDITHARSALSMVALHGSEAEKKRVQTAVYKKYPTLDPKNKAKTNREMNENIRGRRRGR